MAQELHDTYGFSYDTLKVLQGGWNSWLQENATDPKGYPIAMSATPTPGGTGQGSTDTGAPVLTGTGVLTPQVPAPQGTP